MIQEVQLIPTWVIIYKTLLTKKHHPLKDDVGGLETTMLSIRPAPTSQ